MPETALRSDPAGIAGLSRPTRHYPQRLWARPDHPLSGAQHPVPMAL